MADTKEKKPLGETIKSGFTHMKKHWSTPPPGRYVPYKEWFASIFAVGGDESARHAWSAFGFSFGNVLVGVIYGLPIEYFAIAALIELPLGYLWSFLGWQINDNLGHMSRKFTKLANAVYIPLFLAGLAMLLFVPSSAMGSIMPGFWKIIGINFVTTAWSNWRHIFWRRLLFTKLGRYKMWAYANVIPRLFWMLVIVWAPFSSFPVNERFWLLKLCFAFFGMYEMVNHSNQAVDVISPDQNERIDIAAYPGTIANGLNSIFGFMLPVLGGLVGGTNTISFFRYIVPVVAVAGLAIMYVGLNQIHERIPQPPMSLKPKINFWTGTDAVLRNKYRWLKMVSALVDNLGTGALGLTFFLYLFILRETDWVQGLLGTITMTAVTPGVLLAPLLMRKFEYRTLFFIARGLSIFAQFSAYIALFLGIVDGITFATVVIASGFFSAMFGQVMVQVDGVMNTNLNDYQMWISGERMESFTGVFGWITGPIFTLMGFMIPLMYKNIGYTSNPDVLFMDDIRGKVMMAGCVIVVLGDIASMIPMIWFKFNNKMQKQITKDLAWRAQAGKDLEPVNEAAQNGGNPEAVLRQVIAMREAKAAEED
jgi:Na+/melibiose symporter-like transporter